MSHHAATDIRPGHIPATGAAADAPENTLAAFKLAWQQGASSIDGDFHLTRNRKIVWPKQGLCSETGVPGRPNPAPQASNRAPGRPR